MDVYCPLDAKSGQRRPVLLFVHAARVRDGWRDGDVQRVVSGGGEESGGRGFGRGDDGGSGGHERDGAGVHADDCNSGVAARVRDRAGAGAARGGVDERGVADELGDRTGGREGDGLGCGLWRGRRWR